MTTKGILLAGGTGSRLRPTTIGISKHLIPIYDKPMIYYSLSTLILCGCREFMIISDEISLGLYRRQLADLERIGLEITYMVQASPEGIPQAYLIAEQWLNGDSSYLVLGDNILFGHDLATLLDSLKDRDENLIFTQYVEQASHYGILRTTSYGKPVVDEKPLAPETNDAVIGLYKLDGDAPKLTRQLEKSERGEYEIAHLLNLYLKNKKVNITKLTRGIVWFDAGKVETMYDAASFVRSVQVRQGTIICAPEEIAMRMGLVSKAEIVRLANVSPKSRYEAYIAKVASGMI